VPEVRIVAEPRTEFGRGRVACRAGRVPALYGHGTDTRHVTRPAASFALATKTPNAVQVEGL
jgi:large subunit ribosomal protein L25